MILDWHPSLRVVNATLFTLRPLRHNRPQCQQAEHREHSSGNLFQWMAPVQLASYLPIHQ